MSNFFGDLIIAGASAGVAYIDLIELVIECLPIVHLGVQTAREQATHTKPAFETPCRSTSRAGERLLMPGDRNWTATHWNVKGKDLQNYNCDAAPRLDELDIGPWSAVFCYVSPGIGG